MILFQYDPLAEGQIKLRSSGAVKRLLRFTHEHRHQKSTSFIKRKEPSGFRYKDEPEVALATVGRGDLELMQFIVCHGILRPELRWVNRSLTNLSNVFSWYTIFHDDVIKWKHFPRYWPWDFTGHWLISRTKASDAELWCFLWSAPWINGWVNNREAGDLRRHRAHYDVIVMFAFPRNISHLVPLEIRWRLRIADAELSSNFKLKVR